MTYLSSHSHSMPAVNHTVRVGDWQLSLEPLIQYLATPNQFCFLRTAPMRSYKLKKCVVFGLGVRWAGGLNEGSSVAKHASQSHEHTPNPNVVDTFLFLVHMDVGGRLHSTLCWCFVCIRALRIECTGGGKTKRERPGNTKPFKDSSTCTAPQVIPFSHRRPR